MPCVAPPISDSSGAAETANNARGLGRRGRTLPLTVLPVTVTVTPSPALPYAIDCSAVPTGMSAMPMVLPVIFTPLLAPVA